MTMQTTNTKGRAPRRPNFHSVPTYRGTSVEGLLAAVTDLRDRTEDRLLPQGGLRFGHKVFEDGGVDLHADVPLPVGTFAGAPERLFLSRIAQEQIASKADVPVKYADRMAVEEPGLYATTMETWFAREPNANRLLRCIRSDRTNDPADGTDLVLRAFLSDRFRVIDHHDVVLTALGAAVEARPDYGPPRCFKWDIGARNLDVLLFGTENAVDVRNPDVAPPAEDVAAAAAKMESLAAKGWIHRYANPSDKGSGGASIVFPAVRIRNSESGHGGLMVEATAVEALCSNGWTLGVDLVKYHLGRTLTEDLVASRETMKLENELIFAKVADAVKAAFRPESFLEVVRAMRGLRETNVPNVGKAIASIVRRADLGKGAAEDIRKLYVRVTDEYRDTAFDVCRAATSLAAYTRSTGDIDRGYDIEKAVAGVLAGGVPADMVAA